jgi:PAS domain S-box-containing protein
MPIANLNQKLPSLGSIVVGGASPLENRQPLIVAPDLPLVEVISLMSQAKGQTCLLPSSNSTPSTALEISAAARHSSVLVIADRRLVGIFTERDLVKLTASQTDLQRVTVGDVMTIDPIALELSENHTVMTALGLFQQHQIRHLPILDDRQQLIGIVTPEHIRQVLQPINLLKFKSVSEGMTTEVIHALPTATVLEVAQMMNDRNIGSIVIVDGQEQLKPVGIVTEGDLVQFQAFELDLDQLLVATVMSSPLFCLQPTDSLWAAQQVMQTKQIRQLVITNDRGELAGILTRSNLLQLFDPLETIYMVEHLQSQLIELATQLEQTNRELQAEAARRAQVEAELRRASQTREAPVTARTDELALLTAELHLQIVGQQAALRERQQAEEDLVRFNQALSHAMEGIALLDLQGHYLQINQAYADTVGYKPEAMVGMDWQQTLHPDDLANMQIAYQHMQAHGKVEVSARGIRSDGSIFYKQLVMVTNYNSQQQQIGHYCFMKDISAAKQAEVDLIHSERKFRAIFDNTFQFVGLLDVDGKLLEANRTALEAIGVTSDEVVGQLFWATPWWTHSPDCKCNCNKRSIWRLRVN